ncbi:hypothetical protein, partial [Shigella boydii]|uniref:hypothetical protein n=1 Tax=Shigella boydii TaxID=621 RepID=UPI0019D3FCA7
VREAAQAQTAHYSQQQLSLTWITEVETIFPFTFHWLPSFLPAALPVRQLLPRRAFFASNTLPPR